MTTTSVKRVLDSPALTRALQVAAALSLILAIAVGIKQYSLASCLADYSDASATSTAERAAAAAEDRRLEAADKVATDALIDQVLNAKDPAQVRAAYDQWKKTRTETDKARLETEKRRQENQPPASPSLRCG